MCKTFTWHHWMVTSRAVQLNTWQVTKQNSNTCMDCRPFRKHENKMFDVADTFAFSSHTLRSHNWTSRTLYQTCLYFIYTGFFRWLSDFYEGLRERRKTEQRKKTSNENLESKNAFFVCVCLCADTLWLLLKLYRNESWKEKESVKSILNTLVHIIFCGKMFSLCTQGLLFSAWLWH